MTPNRNQKRAGLAIMKRRPQDLKEKAAKIHASIDEMAKDQMAEKIIDAFVGSLVASPLKVRIRFALGLIFNW